MAWDSSVEDQIESPFVAHHIFMIIITILSIYHSIYDYDQSFIYHSIHFYDHRYIYHFIYYYDHNIQFALSNSILGYKM